MYVQVYRSSQLVDEFDIEASVDERIIYPQLALHFTPFRPKALVESDRNGEELSGLATCRKGHELQINDRLVDSKTDRVFYIKWIDVTPGAFSANSILLGLKEYGAGIS